MSINSRMDKEMTITWNTHSKKNEYTLVYTTYSIDREKQNTNNTHHDSFI